MAYTKRLAAAFSACLSAFVLFVTADDVVSTVTLDPSPGSGGTLSVTATNGLAMPGPVETPTFPGYSFYGYYFKGVQYYATNGASAHVWNVGSNATLYSGWIPRKFTVTLYGENPYFDSENVTATYGEMMAKIDPSTRIKPGYTFDGYFYRRTKERFYNADGTCAKAWDKAPTASWDYLMPGWIAHVDGVTLDPRPGDGALSLVSATNGVIMPTPIAIPTRRGYTFNGYWIGTNCYYRANGSAALYWNVGSNATLTAQWTPKAYSAWLDPRPSPSSGTENIIATNSLPMPTPITIPSRSGYSFGGYWYGTNQYYDAMGASSHVFDIPDDSNTIVFVAKWIGRPYTATFEKYYGEGGTNSVTATNGLVVPGPIAIPSYSGFSFAGYIDAGGWLMYDALGCPVGTYEYASDATFYARYVRNAYTVTFSSPLGYAGTPSAKAVYLKRLPSPIVLPRYTGHSCTGYWMDGTQYYTASGTSSRVWSVASNATMTARWTNNVYKISFLSYPGSGGTSSTNVTYDALPPRITPPARAGYAFAGYMMDGSLAFDSTGSCSNVWRAASNTVLRAKWLRQ